jgi:mannitol/fructose-specific phosphotransferase system IIA component (Ntr-type)
MKLCCRGPTAAEQQQQQQQQQQQHVDSSESLIDDLLELLGDQQHCTPAADTGTISRSCICELCTVQPGYAADLQ